MNKKYKLVLFDLDGVIIDSRENMEVSWEAVQAVFQLDVPFEEYFKLIGRPFFDIMDQLGLGDKARKIKPVYDIASSSRLDLVRPYAGCIEVIRRIKKSGSRVGIITSKDETRALEIIRMLDILFDVVESANENIRGKPNPDPVLRALIECHSDPSETVLVGDMEVDRLCASRAGIDYIHASWGYGEPGGNCKVVQEPEGLIELIHA